MALGENRERIYVTVSTEMASRIDFYREKMGLSRSAFCAYLVGQGVMSMDKAMGIWDDMGKAIVEKTSNAVIEVAENGEQIELTSCNDCANDCKDEVAPDELGVCKKYRPRGR